MSHLRYELRDADDRTIGQRLGAVAMVVLDDKRSEVDREALDGTHADFDAALAALNARKIERDGVERHGSVAAYRAAMERGFQLMKRGAV